MITSRTTGDIDGLLEHLREEAAHKWELAQEFRYVCPTWVIREAELCDGWVAAIEQLRRDP